MGKLKFNVKKRRMKFKVKCWKLLNQIDQRMQAFNERFNCLWGLKVKDQWQRLWTTLDSGLRLVQVITLPMNIYGNSKKRVNTNSRSGLGKKKMKRNLFFHFLHNLTYHFVSSLLWSFFWASLPSLHIFI